MAIELRTTLPSSGRAARHLRKRGQQFLERLGRPEAVLSVLLVGDDEIQRLNREWRGKDRPTDVLSFPISDQPWNRALLGDVVISMETAARRARQSRSPIERELDRYLAHGVLHLLGYDHERAVDARKMAELEAGLVGAVGLIGVASASTGAGARPRSGRAEHGGAREGSSRHGRGRPKQRV